MKRIEHSVRSSVTARIGPHRPGTVLTLLAAAVVAGTLVSGCSADPGETTCGDFLGQSSGDQKSTTTDLLEQNGHDDPSGLTVGAARMAIQGYCNIEGNGTHLQNALDDFDSATDSITDGINNFFNGS